MSTIVTRTGKGSPLTTAEMDANFTNLNNDKIEITGSPVNGYTVVWNSATSTWVPGLAGTSTTLTDDTTTNASYYVGLANATSGNWANAFVSSTQLYFNPATGTLSSTNFNSLSDANLKTNIETINNSTEIVNQLRGVSFNWVDSGKKSYGVIAQEIEQVIPDVVSTNEHDVKSVNYSAIIGFLIESNKELQKRIEVLESK